MRHRTHGRQSELRRETVRDGEDRRMATENGSHEIIRADALSSVGGDEAGANQQGTRSSMMEERDRQVRVLCHVDLARVAVDEPILDLNGATISRDGGIFINNLCRMTATTYTRTALLSPEVSSSAISERRATNHRCDEMADLMACEECVVLPEHWCGRR